MDKRKKTRDKAMVLDKYRLGLIEQRTGSSLEFLHNIRKHKESNNQLDKASMCMLADTKLLVERQLLHHCNPDF